VDILRKKLHVLETRLKNIKEKAESDIQNVKKDLTADWFETEWFFLQASEKQLTQLMAGEDPPTKPGNLEFGPILYILNNLPELCPKYRKAMCGVVDLLQCFGMPKSSVSHELWEEWGRELRGKGVVVSDGAILAGDGSLKYLNTYVQGDPGWALAVVEYVKLKIENNAHEFGCSPVHYTAPQEDKLTVLVVGDWGTGIWNDGREGTTLKCPSQLVMEEMSKHQADLYIHLGDVYYAGTEDGLLGLFPGEEKSNFTDLWKLEPSFTLNSNHEMYDGAHGYFDTALTSPAFATQNGASFFSINFGDWILLGLDSAYYDPSTLFMEGALYKDRNDMCPGERKQYEFIQKVGKTNKKIMVMSHHTGMDNEGGSTNKLWDQVTEALGRNPDYWYWGHIHNGVVYSNQSAAGLKGTKCRCSGHGAVPFGNGYVFEQNSAPKSPLPFIEFYTNTPMPNPEIPQQELRVLNGFTKLSFTPSGLSEEFIQVSNDPSLTKTVWSQSS